MIYLDNAATTAISPKVMDVLKESMESDFANPGTIYSIGLDAKKKVERAKQNEENKQKLCEEKNPRNRPKQFSREKRK